MTKQLEKHLSDIKSELHKAVFSLILQVKESGITVFQLYATLKQKTPQLTMQHIEQSVASLLQLKKIVEVKLKQDRTYYAFDYQPVNRFPAPWYKSSELQPNLVR